MEPIRDTEIWIGCRVVALACISLTISSCSRRLNVYPVQGQVIYDGKPAEGAWVFFNPTNQSGDTGESHPPYGIADAQGNFELTSYEIGDGAPAGDYAVTVVLRKDTGHADQEGEDLIPPRYANTETSGLQATVARQAMRLEPFVLSSEGWKSKPVTPRRDNSKRTTLKAGRG
jgi:hypothetical protein